MPRGIYKKTPEHLEKFRQALLGNKNTLGYRHSPGARENMSQAQKILHASQEFRAKLSSALRGKRCRPLGYKHSDKTREKMRVAALKQPPRSAATREKLRQARLREWQNPDHRKKMLAIHRTPEYRENRRRSRLQQRFSKKMTAIEMSLYEQFKKRRLKFEMHKTLFGRWQPDFVFENVHLIVEADGDYWHRRLRKDHSPLFQAAAENGWTVWRFAESEIVQHPEACGRAVARFIRSH